MNDFNPCRMQLVSFLLALIVATLVEMPGLLTPLPPDAARPAQNAATHPAATRKRIEANFGQLPLSFEFNRGQADADVKFLAHSRRYSLFLTPEAAVMNLHQDSAAATLRLTLAGANAQPRVFGVAPGTEKVSYLLGSDAQQWQRNVPTYGRVKYEGVYPGIDLIWYGNQQQLEYDFIVAPGADPQLIRLRFDGARQLRLENGDLILKTQAGEVRHHKPAIYQLINGERREVAGRYLISGRNQVSFETGAYDHTAPLVIDPTISYGTWLNDLTASDIAVDAQGNAYVVGTVGELFQASPGAIRPGSVTLYPGTTTIATSFVAVMKINPQGTEVLYKAVLGGTRGIKGSNLQTLLVNEGVAIAVDAAGSAYVTGRTATFDFPTTAGALEGSFTPQNVAPGTIAVRTAPFVSKLNADGSGLIYSTLLGSKAAGLSNAIADIAVDAMGQACVTGQAGNDWPVSPTAFQPAPAGAVGGALTVPDAFVTKLNSSGTGLIFSTYLGGSSIDAGKSVATDASGNVYIAGVTIGSNQPLLTPFPATQSFYQGEVGEAAFLAKFDPAGGRVYTDVVAPLGRFAYNLKEKLEISVDAAGNAWLGGTTSTAGLTVTANAYQPTGGSLEKDANGDPVPNDDIFIVGLKPAGDALLYATYLGKKDEQDNLLGLTVNDAGKAMIIGWSATTATNGHGFAVQLDTGSNSLSEPFTFTQVRPVAVAFGQDGDAYLTGAAASDFASTPGVINPTSVGGGAATGRRESVLVRISGLAGAPVPPVPVSVTSDTPQTLYYISGRVLDNQGRGIEKVRVVLSGSDSRADYTDRNGSYSLGNVQSGGTYKVAVELASIRTQFKTYYPNPGWYTYKNLSSDQRADFKYELLSPWVPPPDDGTPTPTPTATPTPTPTPGGSDDGKILNPGFEDGLAFWTSSGIVTLEHGKLATEGSTAIRLQPASLWRATQVEQIVRLTPGATYDLCADMGTEGRARASLGAFTVATTDGYSEGSLITAPGGATRKVTLRFTVPAGATEMKFVAQATGNVGTSAIVDNFRLVRVN
ncbi:MAG: SBBP repeat-containing protein [Blastocatellia bacterium]